MTELTLADVLDVEYPGRPAWADDGAHVAAPVYEDDRQALLVARLETGGSGAPGVSRTRYRPGEGYVADVAWRPGPPEIAVATDDGELHLVDAEPGDASRLAESPDGIAEPTWDSDDDRLVYYRGGQPVVRTVPSTWSVSGVQRSLAFISAGSGCSRPAANFS